MKDSNRMKIFFKLIESLEENNQLMNSYDAIPHIFGEYTLYQAESHTIQVIGKNPNCTITELARKYNRTPSAFSQIVYKLRKKGLVEQLRNEENNREYHLSLTPNGWNVYEAHETLDNTCYLQTFKNLSQFTDKQLEDFIDIQKNLNDSFREDVQRAQTEYSNCLHKN